MNSLDWEQVRVFLAVAETRSMSEAARQLRLTQPTVSRRLQSLESDLGYALFRRSVAGVQLTSEGERLLGPARKMAEWAGEATRAARSHQRGQNGLVRIACAPGVAWDFVVPFVAWLRGKEPGLDLEVLSSVQYLDLARGEADLALRSRPAEHSDLTTVATLHHRNAVFIHRRLAARLPKRVGFADLPWVAWAPPFDQVPPNPQLAALVPGFRPSFTADNFLMLLRAAECGLGAIVLGAAQHRFSRPSPLVPLDLPLGAHGEGALHLVCARSALDIPRVRWVADRLVAELSAATS